MSKLPKCAYVKGDLITQDGQMGVVTDADGDFYTYQLIGINPLSHTTMNVSVKHYLKLVKAQVQVMSSRTAAREWTARNMTLEELLTVTDPQPLIDGEVNRLVEDTKNKTVENGE